MKIYNITEDTCMQVMKNIIENREEAYQVGIVQKSCVLKGKGDYNRQYCETNNITVIPGFNIGNPIVLSKGDIEIGYFTKLDANKLFKNLKTEFLKFLISKNIDAVFDGNDFMVENNKIAASSLTILNGLYYIGMHFSVNMNLELIDNICIKPRVKIPKGLSDYGIMTEDIIGFLDRFNDLYLDKENI